MDEIKEVFSRINLAMERFSTNFVSKVKTLLHQLNDGLKKLKLNKEDDLQRLQYQEKLLLLFRKTLSELMKNWSNQDSEDTSDDIKELLKLIFWCAKKEIVLPKDALSFSEEFCDMLSVNNLREFIDIFEKSLHTLNHLSETDRNYPLKICNVIFKKLTRTYDTSLRGELHIFLSKILPICHASGLKSKICTETTAQVDTSAEIKESINSNNSNGMEIEDDKGSSENITYPNKEFYKKFWTLQKYFQNPLNLSIPNDLSENEKVSASSTGIEEEEVEEGEEKLVESKKIKAVCSTVHLVLDRFNQNPVFEKRETNIKPYIKYLTTYSLLEKQLNDQFFRKIWLLQAMLFFNAIQNKTKDLEIKNLESDMALIKSTEEKVKAAFILLHKNLKEEINIDKLDLFFADEKIWVDRKDNLVKDKKDEKYNFKNPCENIRQMIEQYNKSILIPKEERKNSEFTFDSHNMLLQKQFTDMEAFKKKLIADCSKTGGNTITEDTNIKQILGVQMEFPIKTEPIQKSVGFYIEQVIADLKDSNSEKKIDNTTFVTKAMRSISRYSLNWVDKEKDNNLKDLEDFAKEILDKDGDKLDKDQLRDKSVVKESNVPIVVAEPMQIEEQKKSKSDKPQKLNDTEDIQQDKNITSQIKSDDKIQGSKIITKDTQEKTKSSDSSRNIPSSNGNSQQPSQNKEKGFSSSSAASGSGQKVNDDQKSRSSDDSKIRNSEDQKSRSNEDRPRRDDRNDRFIISNNNNEIIKQDQKIEDPIINSRLHRSENDRDRTQSQDITNQDEKQSSSTRSDNYQNEKGNSKIDDKSSSINYDRNDDNKYSSKDEKSRSDDRNSQNSQSRQQSSQSSRNNDDKVKKNDNRQKDEGLRQSSQQQQQQSDEDIKRHDDNRKSSFKDDGKRSSYDDSRKNNFINDSGNNEKNDSNIRQNQSGNSQNRSTGNFSSKSDNKPVDDIKQPSSINNSGSSSSNNNSSQQNNSGSKPQLVLKKNDNPSSSNNNSSSSANISSGNISGTQLFKEPQNRSRSKEKSQNSYQSNRGGGSSNNSQYNNNMNNSFQGGQFNNNSKYNSRDDNNNKQSNNNGSYNSSSNYNQNNSSYKGNGNNNNSYQNKRDYPNNNNNNNNGQYDNKRDNYDRKSYQNNNNNNNNYYRNNDYDSGPHKKQKN